MTRTVDQIVPLPNSSCGAHMNAQGFGTWRGDNETVGKAVTLAIKAGYRVFDCARMYGNEAAIGLAIEVCLKEGVVKREDLFIVAKIWNTDHRPEVAKAAALKSLKDLRCGYLDLLLIHWPVAWVHPQDGEVENQTIFVNIDPSTGASKMDESVTILDTYKAMESLVDDKLVKDIGVSNFSIDEIDALLAPENGLKYLPVVNQVEVHPSLPNDALRAFCASKGIVMMAYKPYGIGGTDIAGGLLNNAEIKKIAEEAFALGELSAASAPLLLLQWNCQKGNVALCKSTTPERIASNAAVPFGGLSQATMDALAAFGKANPKRLCNPDTFTGKKELYFKD